VAPSVTSLDRAEFALHEYLSMTWWRLKGVWEKRSASEQAALDHRS
jgi:hypothetical protein